jgi:CubicO group peptidase (beta-lactamase class C family)
MMSLFPGWWIRLGLPIVLLFVGSLLSSQDWESISSGVRAGKYGTIKTLIVQVDGEIVHESYYRGWDENDLQLTNSITKSVGVTLVGMALKQGLLDFEAPIAELLPEYDFSSETYAHNRMLDFHSILSMKHGLEWDEFGSFLFSLENPAGQMFQTDDWYAFTLSRNREIPVDTEFNYCSGISGLMGAILRNATGKKPQELLQEWIAEPLGIKKFAWEFWSARGVGSGFDDFPFDEAPLGLGLWLKPRDMLKFGELWLNKGGFDGERYFEPEWSQQVWTTYSDSNNDPFWSQSDEFAGYGYQWWYREVVDASGRIHPCWFAHGAGRQYILIFPDIQTIVVSTADDYQYQGPGAFTLLRERILPFIEIPGSFGYEQRLSASTGE